MGGSLFAFCAEYFYELDQDYSEYEKSEVEFLKSITIKARMTE